LGMCMARGEPWKSYTGKAGYEPLGSAPVKSRGFCKFLQASPLFYRSMSIASLASRSSKRRCSLSSSMFR
jgi:hypothetical protein